MKVSAGPSAGVAGACRPGAVPGGDGGDVALRVGDDGVGVPLGGRAHGGMGVSGAKGTVGAADCRDGSAEDSGARCLGGDGGEGGEKQPSSCGICLFLASTAARLLARVSSLKVFASFLCGGAGCGDKVGGGNTCDGGVGNSAAGSGDAGGGDATNAG